MSSKELKKRLKATRRRRFFAFFVDLFIAYGIADLVNAIVGLVNGYDMHGYDHGMISMWLWVVVPYFLLSEYLFSNSVGKFLFGLSVRDKNTFEKISIWRHIFRNLFKAVWFIEFFVLIFNKGKQRLGDMVSTAVVVQREGKGIFVGLRIFMVAIPFFVLVIVNDIVYGVGFETFDIYKTGISHLQDSNKCTIDGMPYGAKMNYEAGYFDVPVIQNNIKKRAQVCLEWKDSVWEVFHVEFDPESQESSFEYNALYSRVFEYHPNGMLQFEGAKIGALKEGKCYWYYDNNQLAEASTWHKDLPIGDVVKYYKNGQMASKGKFLRGMRTGTATMWYENGNFKEIMFYKNDMLDGKFMSFHSNGEVKESGNYSLGFKNGKWDEFDKNGKLVRFTNH